MRKYAIIVAGGAGSRMRVSLSKQFVLLIAGGFLFFLLTLNKY